MRVRLIVACDTESGQQEPGFEIEGPHAYRLCELSLAEPVDDEARAALASFLGGGGVIGQNVPQVEPPQEAE